MYDNLISIIAEFYLYRFRLRLSLGLLCLVLLFHLELLFLDFPIQPINKKSEEEKLIKFLRKSLIWRPYKLPLHLIFSR